MSQQLSFYTIHTGFLQLAVHKFFCCSETYIPDNVCDLLTAMPTCWYLQTHMLAFKSTSSYQLECLCIPTSLLHHSATRMMPSRCCLSLNNTMALCLDHQVTAKDEQQHGPGVWQLPVTKLMHPWVLLSRLTGRMTSNTGNSCSSCLFLMHTHELVLPSWVTGKDDMQLAQ